MYIIVDDRESVANSYVGGLVREGVSSVGFSASEFWDWLQSASESDLAAVDAFITGHFESDDKVIAASPPDGLRHLPGRADAGGVDCYQLPGDFGASGFLWRRGRRRSAARS